MRLAHAKCFAVAAILSAAPLASARAPDLSGLPRSPACDLLTADDVRQATGRQEYGEGDTGDMPGEGVGGGTSCQWDRQGNSGERVPMVGVVLIPRAKGYMDGRKAAKPRAGCTREEVSGLGEYAFFEVCPKQSELPLFVKTRGSSDLVVTMQVRSFDPAALKPQVVALAKVAVAKVK